MAEPGSKKSPVKEAFIDDGLHKQLREKFPWLLPGFSSGYKFSGGSTAKAMDMLEKNHGYLAVVADEARNFFPASMSSTGQCNESQHLKPEALLPFRTGSGVERQLLKNQKEIEKTQVAMAFMSQFPAARAFLVQVVKNLSIGWAQGFIFLYAEDRVSVCFSKVCLVPGQSQAREIFIETAVSHGKGTCLSEESSEISNLFSNGGTGYL